MYSLQGFLGTPPEGRATAAAPPPSPDTAAAPANRDGAAAAADLAACFAMTAAARWSGSDHPHHIFSTDMALRSP